MIEAKGIGKSYGGRAIVSDFSIRIQRGDRIGIVGPNGSGKTTLVKMLTGVLPPDSGAVRLGSNLAVATLDQHRDSLDPNVTVKQALTGGDGDTVMVNGAPKHVVSYMKDFLFSSEQVRTPLGKLSGGERGRLMLAQALAKPSNLLILDEPTNDLDMETLDVLEDMLGDYPGTVLLISHDRDFLDRLVSGVIAPEGDGRWTEYAGGYSDMLTQRGADLTREQGKQEKPAKTAAAAAAEPQAPKRKMKFKEKHALETLPKTMAALLTPKPMSCRPSSTIRNSICATAPVSKKSPPTSAKPSASWPRPRSNGWSSKSCARNSPASLPANFFW